MMISEKDMAACMPLPSSFNSNYTELTTLTITNEHVGVAIVLFRQHLPCGTQSVTNNIPRCAEPDEDGLAIRFDVPIIGGQPDCTGGGE